MPPPRTTHLPQDITWENWGKLFTDLPRWRPVVERICHVRELGQARRVEVAFPGSCAVFLVDRQVVLKLFPPFFAGDFHRAREIYQSLGSQIREIPTLLADGIFRDRIDWPFLALEYRTGDPIRELRSSVDSDQMRHPARELGRLIRRVHEAPLSEFAHFDGRPQAWHRFLSRRLSQCLTDLRQKTSLPDSILAEVGKFLETTELMPAAFEPVLINADLTEDHLLLVHEAGSWRISALIDWADAEAGAPEYEWVALWFGLCGGDAGMFRQVLSAYDPALRLDGTFRRRAMAHTFLHRFGAEIISTFLGDSNHLTFKSLDQLQNLLWPPF